MTEAASSRTYRKLATLLEETGSLGAEFEADPDDLVKLVENVTGTELRPLAA